MLGYLGGAEHQWQCMNACVSLHSVVSACSRQTKMSAGHSVTVAFKRGPGRERLLRGFICRQC